MSLPHTSLDVLGLGCTAVDDVVYVPSHPERDGKVPVVRRTRRMGGLIGAALVAAARMGARCGYAGQLGLDDLSNSVRDSFIAEGIDVSHAPRLAEARVIHSTVIVAEDDGSRSILYDCHGVIGAHPALPEADYLRACAVLLVDHYGLAGTVRAARIARAAKIAVVADFEDNHGEGFEELLNLSDHLILSRTFALKLTSQREAGKAALALWGADRAAVIVTCGAEGCWSVDSASSEAVHYPAFAVKAVDTAGCGDVFHGAYAAALARGDSLAKRIRFASAAAALRARQSDIPRLAEVEQFF